jgi:RNA polymerase sigma factor (sigma-70 family)
MASIDATTRHSDRARPTLRFPVGDERLVRLAAAGDQRAVEAIFERYHDELFRYCRAILSDPHEAQDAVQATMVAALRALPGETREIALKPWLYRVAHNEAISMVRRRLPVVEPNESMDVLAMPGPDVELADRERLRSLVRDVGSLPDRQRSALVMRELNDLSHEEIAGALGCTEAVARQTLYEARVALRDMEKGRDMSCDVVRRQISDGDGRVLRGRRLRAHLRTCEACQGFSTAIERRRGDLRLISPPLPPLVSAGLLAAILGETSGGAGGVATGAGAVAAGASTAGLGLGGAGGGAVGTGALASAGVKAASVLAAMAVGAGAADATGVVHLPMVHHDPASPAASANPASSSSDANEGSAAGATNAGSGHDGAPGQPGSAPGHARTQGNSASAPGHTSTHGSSGSAPGHTSTHGSSASAPGHTSTHGSSASAPRHTSATHGNSASAPRHTGAALGNSASAPRHTGAALGNPGTPPGRDPTHGNGGGSAQPATTAPDADPTPGNGNGHDGSHGPPDTP